MTTNTPDRDIIGRLAQSAEFRAAIRDARLIIAGLLLASIVVIAGLEPQP